MATGAFTQTTALMRRGIANFITSRPFCVSFEITRSCNARCGHCHLGGPAQEVRASADRYGEICRELKPVVAQVSGGEPLVRRDLEQIIRALKRTDGTPFVVLTTNAALLTRARYESLRAAGVDEFSVSLDYPDERHDEFRTIPGLFGKISNLVGQLNGNGAKGITLACVVQNYNYRELWSMVELARRWDVRINFSTYTPLRTSRKDYLVPRDRLPELKEILGRLVEDKRRHGTVRTSDYVFGNMLAFFANEAVPDCRAGEKFLVVNPDGTLSPCGLVIRSYRSRSELLHDFGQTNDCTLCYTSIRANTEKPPGYLIKDSLRAIRFR